MEYKRKEEVKHKEDIVKKLDDKALLLNLKKEEEESSNNNLNSNELSAANISISTSLALPSETINNSLGLVAPKEKTEK